MRFDTMSILVVDDSLDVHTQLKIFLRPTAATLHCADSVAAAFEYLGLAKGGQVNEAIDLILMDISMEGINGIEATRRIKAAAEFQDVPVLMITGDTSKESLMAAFAAGAVDYITKPLNKIELVARVSSFLKLKAEIDARKMREKELAEALVQVKALKGLLPICAACKKIRDDGGYWQQLETYIIEHSEAAFTHSICPECCHRLYPDLDID